MKIVDRPNQVKLDQQGNPQKVLLYDGWHAVADQLDCWADTGRWWVGENEKMFYRLFLEKGQVVEIYQDLVEGNWQLYKIYD